MDLAQTFRIQMVIYAGFATAKRTLAIRFCHPATALAV